MFVNISNGCKSSTPTNKITCKTVRSSNETLDSGFFSPVANSDKMNKDPTFLSTDILQISPLKMPLSPLKIKNESVMSEMTDISISEEWEKDFFSNFEENLFNMDIDDQILSDILKSPKGKAAMNVMIKSPKGKAFVNRMMRSPKGKLMRNQMDYGLTDSPLQESPHFSDAKKLSATPMKPEMKGMLKLSNSKRRLTMTEPNTKTSRVDNVIDGDVYIHHNILKTFKSGYVPIQPKENVQPVIWPSKERLKFARAQFSKTLANAVQRVSEDTSKKKVKFQEPIKQNLEKYPEIKQALERPAGQVKSSRRQFHKTKSETEDPKDIYVPFMESNESTLSSYSYYDDDSDDETWTTDLPFTYTQKRSKNSSGQNKRRKYSKSKV